MRARLFLFAAFLPAAMAADAKVYTLEGKIGDKYPIVIELEDHDNGVFSGRYAYRSTLRKNGDVNCSWLFIRPDIVEPQSRWNVSDCNHEQVEVWYNVKFDGRKRLSARMKNKAGKYFDVVATSGGGQTSSDGSLDAYYRQHMGQMVCDFDMFNDPRVKNRLVSLMGSANYRALKNIYQTQGDIQYNNGMYWGSGYMAHQCCDPATVWAYDTHNNSFYIWVRRDGNDRWWSETGEIPLKFREIVYNIF